eukprot:Gb_35281 [translate_table: standard]
MIVSQKRQEARKHLIVDNKLCLHIISSNNIAHSAKSRNKNRW